VTVKVPPVGFETVTTPLTSEVVEPLVVPEHEVNCGEPETDPEVVRVMDLTVVSTVVVPPWYALITGWVAMIAPEYPAAGWVLKDRYDEVEPETAICPDSTLLNEGLLATRVKYVAVGDDVVKLIVQPEYVTTPLRSLELHPESVPAVVGFPEGSPRVSAIGDRSVASGLLP
jgi:hypothetical protein